MKKMLILAFALGGCAATIPSSEQVKIRAAHDLQCSADQVQTTQVDAKTIKVSACGQERTYTEDCVTAETTRCTWVSRAAGPTASAGAATTNP
jgi:hypothetical protein